MMDKLAKDKFLEQNSILPEQVRAFETMFNSTLDIIIYLDLEMKVLAFNNALIQNFYLERKDIIGKSLKYVFESKVRGGEKRLNEIWPKMEQAIYNTQNSGKASQVLEKLFVDSGKYICYNILISPVFGANGKIGGTVVTARDMTKEVMLTSSLKERSEQLECILDNMPIYGFLKNRQGEFVMGSSAFTTALFANKKLPDMLTNEQVFAKGYVDLVRAEEEEIFKTKQTVEVERTIRFVNKDVFCRIHKSPLLDENGDVKFLVVMCENIEQKREIENQREYFTKLLIHDLKVPTIAQLRGMELLSKGILGPVNQSQRELIDEISTSCNYVLEMISTVLNAYRLESGEKQLMFSKFKVKDLLRDSLKEVKGSNHSFRFEVKPRTLEIFGDRAALQNVVSTLISSNATTENEEAVFEISVVVKKDEVCFTISRPGIALFESEENLIPFGKLLHNAKFTTVGYGVGLYMCKKIIDLHKGTIYASADGSNVNLITFTIPKHD